MTPGPGRGPYRLRVELAQHYTNPGQLRRDRPVGGIGNFHTVRGGINPGDISVLVPGLSKLYICESIVILGMDSIVPR